MPVYSIEAKKTEKREREKRTVQLEDKTKIDHLTEQHNSR